MVLSCAKAGREQHGQEGGGSTKVTSVADEIDERKLPVICKGQTMKTTW